MATFDRQRFYLGGQWADPASTDTIPVENPYTEEIIAHVPAGTAEDVDRAVAAARAAFEGWAATPMAERGAVLDRLHTVLAAQVGDLARMMTLEVGTPLALSRQLQTQFPLTVLRSYADLAMGAEPEETIGNSLIVHEPVGVVAAITPWNFPLHQTMAKVAAALAAGCTIVLKPSEITPLVSYLLMDAADEAGVPAGVLNLVVGSGATVGAAMTGHPAVDMVSFTGSTASGRAISHAAADRIARVSLELGGKSAQVILDDANLPGAVAAGIGRAFLNNGQACTAWTRMLVHRGRYDDAVELAAKAAARYTLGDPLDERIRIGPLVSDVQRTRVRGFIERSSARLVAGGLDAPVPGKGHFVAPTVFADVEPDSELAQEEVFGPVLAIIRFTDDDEAVAIANNSRYGLTGAVWGDEERALAVARRIRTGSVSVNGGATNPLAPIGGYKQSGNGRELGTYGLDEFREMKAIHR